MLNLIGDNYATYRPPEVKAWLNTGTSSVRLHFTPTGALGFNTVERFFCDVTDKRIRHDSFISVAELELAIEMYVAHHNLDSKPFIWTAKATDILAKLVRAVATMASVGKNQRLCVRHISRRYEAAGQIGRRARIDDFARRKSIPRRLQRHSSATNAVA